MARRRRTSGFRDVTPYDPSSSSGPIVDQATGQVFSPAPPVATSTYPADAYLPSPDLTSTSFIAPDGSAVVVPLPSRAGVELVGRVVLYGAVLVSPLPPWMKALAGLLGALDLYDAIDANGGFPVIPPIAITGQ